MVNIAVSQYRSIAAKYDEDFFLLGIMVISWSLAAVHNTIYDPFEHTHILANMHTDLVVL